MSALVLLEHGVRWKDRSWGVIFVHFFILADVNEIYLFHIFPFCKYITSTTQFFKI